MIKFGELSRETCYRQTKEDRAAKKGRNVEGKQANGLDKEWVRFEKAATGCVWITEEMNDEDAGEFRNWSKRKNRECTKCIGLHQGGIQESELGFEMRSKDEE